MPIDKPEGYTDRDLHDMEKVKGQPVWLPLVDIEQGARAIAALRYPHAPAVTPHSRELAMVCAAAWGLKW